MSKEEVVASEAPKPTGAYSQAVVVDGWCFVSGQVGWDADRSGLETRSAGEQAVQALENISRVLAAADMSLKDVVRATVYLADFSTFGEVNAAYERKFRDEGATVFPARTTVGANILVAVEIDVTARAKTP